MHLCICTATLSFLQIVMYIQELHACTTSNHAQVKQVCIISHYIKIYIAIPYCNG